MLKDLLKGIEKGNGILCADSAYLSRKNCNLIEEKGRTPYIKPKNSRVKAELLRAEARRVCEFGWSCSFGPTRAGPQLCVGIHSKLGCVWTIG